MVLYESNDTLMWRIFPTSLSEKALEWFHSVKPKSIFSFHDLTQSFVLYYLVNWQEKKNVGTLFRLKSGLGESLQSYVESFCLEISQVQRCDEFIIVIAFQ